MRWPLAWTARTGTDFQATHYAYGIRRQAHSNLVFRSRRIWGSGTREIGLPHGRIATTSFSARGRLCRITQNGTWHLLLPGDVRPVRTARKASACTPPLTYEQVSRVEGRLTDVAKH